MYSDVLFSLMTAGWAEHGGCRELSDRPTLSEQQKHMYSLRGEIKVTVLTHPKAGTCGFITEESNREGQDPCVHGAAPDFLFCPH